MSVKKVFVIKASNAGAPDNMATMLGSVNRFVRENYKKADLKVTIQEFKQTRSHAQNALLWKWLDQLTQYMIDHHDLHATGEDWLDVLAARGILATVVNPLTKEPRRISTTKLNTKEFTQFLERFEMYCGKHHSNLNLVKPEDLYYQAMGY